MDEFKKGDSVIVKHNSKVYIGTIEERVGNYKTYYLVNLGVSIIDYTHDKKTSPPFIFYRGDDEVADVLTFRIFDKCQMLIHKTKCLKLI